MFAPFHQQALSSLEATGVLCDVLGLPSQLFRQQGTLLLGTQAQVSCSRQSQQVSKINKRSTLLFQENF